MKKNLIFLSICIILLGSIGSTNALTITSYDVLNTRLSGYGNWAHTYSGTITPIGGGLYNYTGGSGTMNDGLVGTGTNNTHLFLTSAAPTIIIYLDELVTINQINLYSYGPTSNGIPGNITGLNVTINSTSQMLSTTGFGPNGIPMNNINGQVHEQIDLTGNPLNMIATNSFTLSGFTTMGNYPEYFSISEIELDYAPIPEPGTLILLGTGLLGLAGYARRKNKKS